MGDVIHAMVVLQFIKKQIPSCQIDWIVEDGFKGVLENNPHIDNILAVNLKSIKKKKSEIFNQIKLLNEYAKNQYDIVIDAQGLIKSAIVAKIVGEKKVGSKIVGFDKDSTREGIASWFYNETVNIAYDKNVIDRNCTLISKSLDISISKEDILNKEPFLYSEKIDNDSGNNILFVVGASKENKMYPKELFLEIANNLQYEKIEVVWASEEENKIAHYLEQNGSNICMCEKMNLDKLKLKIQSSKLLIGADTGPTHMAWALNIPSITIFGPTPAYRNTYKTSINKTIKSNTKVDPLKLDYNDYSINKINPQDIANLAKELLT
ncbi:MAG: lipopolysaccharide heptosyltransferase I [Campylobacteraceae bacterium]|nr:lipopolysaccharide heptosyltransferase I [Campylobacteraceae bacterium]MBT4707436.1 lipopolysaccharide heptosyltransferase I [Campylobacteraceae bacterium]MBT5323177.1 lipopolysaccharide heptosyltransferase I [Campylobacteraceae bacterium]MBT6388821.1 lipopolysaccharide heptosyltransferase I [Campylobacteraceae bacterium]MBT6577294.1 lipopolysaccharide heptosyltransferase I [Campylobacteraceae bacterium]